MKTTIKIKPDTIVVMMGAIGTGKSTLAHHHFQEHQIVETDFIQKQLTGNSDNTDYKGAVFEIFFATLAARARVGLLTVLDSTGNKSVVSEAERIAIKYKRPLVLVKLPHLKEEEITHERMKQRMKYLDVYYRMVTRIDEQEIPDTYDVYEVDDINDVVIDVELDRDKYTLDPQYQYVVIPDLHGEHRVLEAYIQKYPEDTTKFVFLGDIVDRGESSYKTFRLVNSLMKSGKGFGVVSNHDNKLMRYFQKWLRDESADKYFIDSFRNDEKDYGMTLGYGMKETVDEFFNLHMHFMDDYAKDFVSYYEGLTDYLYLEKQHQTHFFAHAGITNDTIRGMRVGKRDLSVLIHETLSSVDAHKVLRGSTFTSIHLGHDHTYKTVVEYSLENHNRIVKHDIGLGKTEWNGDLPEFYVI